MKAALISLGSRSSQMTLEAMKPHFEQVDAISLKQIEVSLGDKGKRRVLYEGNPLPEYDYIYAKGSFRYAQLLRSITEILREASFMPIAPEAFTVGHDKILTHLALQQYNIPMPATYLISSAKAGKKLLTEVHYPLIMKFPHGTQGIGVMVADSYGSASSMLDALIALRQPFLIQEYIDTGGVDIRAFVVGNEVVASVKRVASRGEVRANVHMGGTGKAHPLDTYQKRVAIDAAKAIGAEICAVDMLEGPKGPLVIEANVSPGLQGIISTTGVNVAEKIAAYLAKKAEGFQAKRKGQQASEMVDQAGSEDFAQQIIVHPNFRADRILLPKIVTDITRFTETDEIVLKIEKGRITIEKL
ncbi:TPA: RimK family alpha-L-glutamate ligase [Candidatus Woesearchaeota archaeon]|nr:RimK family alpha-L-glutamate ligase [Candidatus Woesearchaeota archaeon]